MASPRKFPTPWRVETIEVGYRVVDANGFRLAYIYAREEEMMRLDHLHRAEAKKLAALISQLPALWAKSGDNSP